jgi:hypothetical protein
MLGETPVDVVGHGCRFGGVAEFAGLPALDPFGRVLVERGVARGPVGTRLAGFPYPSSYAREDVGKLGTGLWERPVSPAPTLAVASLVHDLALAPAVDAESEMEGLRPVREQDGRDGAGGFPRHKRLACQRPGGSLGARVVHGASRS